MVWTYNPTINVVVVIPIGTAIPVTPTNMHLATKNVFTENIFNDPVVVAPPTALKNGSATFADIPIDYGVTTLRAYVTEVQDLDAREVPLLLLGNDAVKRVDNATEVIL